MTEQYRVEEFKSGHALITGGRILTSSYLGPFSIEWAHRIATALNRQGVADKLAEATREMLGVLGECRHERGHCVGHQWTTRLPCEVGLLREALALYDSKEPK